MKNLNRCPTLKTDMAGIKMKLMLRTMKIGKRNRLFDEDLGKRRLVLVQAHPRIIMVALKIS